MPNRSFAEMRFTRVVVPVVQKIRASRRSVSDDREGRVRSQERLVGRPTAGAAVGVAEVQVRANADSFGAAIKAC
jgi:hypothetical protein